ncbi:hypothetical protein RUM43_013576 [Polyplax serrata]|uniref:Uncharacterized protein n=1 Tax=Polyplax serrata TaxID=468196 RepID=A0AAN8RYQ4_POLSC
MGNWLALAFWSLAICLIFVDLTEGDPVGIGTDFSPRFAKDLTESVDLTKNTGRKIVVRSAVLQFLINGCNFTSDEKIEI